MLFTDLYNTISAESNGEVKERGSKFIAYAFPLKTEEEFKERLATIKKEHYNAFHHCSAFVLGFGKEFQKFNDDREPSNSAGRPILRAILSKDLTNIGIVVVRYFGGKLLGVPGLIKAYEDASLAALEHAQIVQIIIKEQYELKVPYVMENDAFRLVKQFGLKVLQHHQGDEITLIFEVRQADADKVLHAIKEKHPLKVRLYATK